MGECLFLWLIFLNKKASSIVLFTKTNEKEGLS